MNFNFRIFALLLTGIIYSSILYAQGVDQQPGTQNIQPQPVHKTLDLRERDQYSVVSRNYFSTQDKYRIGHRKVVSGAVQTVFGGLFLATGPMIVLAGALEKDLFGEWVYPNQPYDYYYAERTGRSMIAIGSIMFAGGLVMCITGPIAIHRGKKMQREALAGDLSFFPTVAPNINSGSKASMTTGVGMKLRF